MRTDDGYVHAWTIMATVPAEVWQPLRADVVEMLRAVSRRLELHRGDAELAVLRGPNGFGSLVLEPDRVAFNGNAFLGQAAEPFSLERVASHGVIAKVGGAGQRRAVHRCDTRGHPYDLAVCASLLVVLRHLGDSSRLGTTGSLRAGWGAAAALVRETLGEHGQLVQTERGMLRWMDAPRRVERERERSSA